MIRIFAWTVLLLIVCNGAARAESCNRFAVSVATDPVPYQHPHGLQRTEALFSKIHHDAQTVLLGDSLIEFWPQALAERQFGQGPVWNIGVGGAETQNLLWQLDKLHAATLSPSRLFLLIGTNNLTNPSMPACAVAAGIEAVVAKAHGRWPKAAIDLMGIPPRGLDFRFRDDVRLELNATLREWAADLSYLHYFELDASEITCGQYDMPLQVADAGPLSLTKPRCGNYADDFGHFKRAGYDVIFSTLTRK